MNVSINLERELVLSRETLDTLKRNCARLEKENKVLREVLAEEINRRIQLENLNYMIQRKDKEKGEALYRVKQMLTDCSRKDELVKSISKLIDNIDF